MKTLSLYILFSFFSISCFAQSNSVWGQVISEEGITLPGATIRIVDTQLVSISDENGFYRFNDLEKGNYTISISYIGFNDLEQSINLEESTTLDFVLSAGVMLDNVIVVGQNLQGISRQLNQQKNNENITNVVSADQVGRFPDANIGDAMKRIPGITMQNDQGEARDILIRGIAPQYNSVTLNGDRIPSAEGDNRNIQMDLIPADMIQLIEVNKAILPEMDADAIGGSVNLVTRAATSDPRLSVTFAPGYSPIRESPNWTGGLIAGKRLLNDKLGIVFTGSLNYKDYGSDNFEAEYDGDELNEFQIRRYDVIRQRLSGGLDLDYRFNENHTIRFNSLVSDRKDWENRYRTVFADFTDTGFETIERQTKAGTPDIKDRRLEHQKVSNFGLVGKHFFGKLKLDWSGSYSEASEDRPNERYIQYVAEGDFTGTVTGFDTDFPNVIGGDAIPLSSYELDEITEEFQFTEEQNIRARLNFTFPIMEGTNNSEIKFGYTYQNKDKVRNNSFFDYTDAFEDQFATLADISTSDYSLEDFNPGSEYRLGTQVRENLLGGLNLTNVEGESVLDEFVPANYDAQEDVNAGYVQYTQNIGPKWSFIVGARLEATNLDFKGNELIITEDEDPTIGAAIGESNYSNFLPGFHANYRPRENSVLRFAWTNSIARPNYYDLVPYLIDDEGEAELGNPDLVAAESMNFDLMGEYYFEEIGLVSLGGFYKNINDFFYNFVDDNDPVINGRSFDEFTQPRNGEEADVYGFEASFQRQLNFLGSFFNNLNLYTNYTYTDSKATLSTREGDELSLPGTAPHLLNASLAFDNGKFNSRLSLNHSADYVNEFGDELAEDIFYDKQTFLDFNANFFFKENWTLFAEANNLTNQPLRFYQGFSQRTFQVEYYEPTFNLGVKLDF